MVKRRHRASDEIMLIPFLDILCSLIGVLVLIIVVLCVAQTQKINGRTPEELARAQEYQKLLKQQKQNEQINAALKDSAPKLAKLQEQNTQRATEVAKLRKLLDTSAATREQNEALSQKMLKELDDLLVEMNGLKSQENPLKQQMAALMAEIKKRQPPERQGPPVVVTPGGSGLAKGTKVFFIEASAGKLTFYWSEGVKNVVSSAADVVAVDALFNGFLKAVHAVPQSKIIFLLRDDGMGAYNIGAGWAQATHGFGVDQIGKLPIPGRGEIDLRMFKEFLGSLTPPPATTPTPPAPATAAPKMPAAANQPGA
jgi:hypothetical protein